MTPITVGMNVFRDLINSSNKNRRKRARKLISFFKKYDNNESLHSEIPLIISPKKINWDILSSKYQKELDRNEADHHIIAEIIINYHDQLEDIYIITADYTFQKFALELGIKCLDWFEDKKYKEIFNSIETKTNSPKLPNLGVYFDSQLARDLTLKKVTKKPKLLSRDDLTEPNVQYDHKWEIENPRAIGNLIKSYNEQSILISNHQEVKLFLINHSNHSYNNIDICITSIL